MSSVNRELRKPIGTIWIAGLMLLMMCAACGPVQLIETAPTASPGGNVNPMAQAVEYGRERDARAWTLSITHQVNQKSPYGESRLQMIWSGSFTVRGGQIAGSGVGQIAGQHGCGDDRGPEYDVTGEFTFQITGRQIARSDGRPLFQLLIEGHDLTLHSDAKCAANFYEIAVASRLQSLVEQLPSLVDHIEIEGRAGATATIPLPDALVLFSKAPLEVELTLASN